MIRYVIDLSAVLAFVVVWTLVTKAVGVTGDDWLSWLVRIIPGALFAMLLAMHRDFNDDD